MMMMMMMKRLACLAPVVALVLGCTGGAPAPEAEGTVAEALSPGSFVQQAFADSNSASTISKAFPAAEKLGDTNVVLVGWNNATTTITAVTDTQGLSYHVAAGLTHFVGAPCGFVGLSQAIYYATGTKAASDTVKVTLSGSTPGVDLRIGEYAGALSLDQGASATGSANPAATGAMALGGSNLVVAGGYICGAFSGAGSGFTLRKLTTFGALYEDRTVTGSPFTPTGASDGTDWVFQAAAFLTGTGSDGGTDAAQDTGTDGAFEAEAGVDAGPDTGQDAPADVGPDVTEAGDDSSEAAASVEAGDDAGVDADADAAVEAGPDASGDAGPPGTPTLVQHVSSSTEELSRGISGNGLTFTPPNAIGAGNALVLGIAYTSGSTWAAAPVTDSVGNAWPSGPSAIVHDSQGNMDLAVFVLPGALPGVDTISLHWTASIAQFSYVLSEYAGIDTASPLNGSIGASGVLAPSLATGSFTPGNNDAQGGNLIWSYFYDDSEFGSGNEVTSFTPGAGFTLLDADIAWHREINLHHATEAMIQTTAGPINPGMTASMAPAADRFVGVSIALRAASAGTLAATGIRIASVLHSTRETPQTTEVVQAPCPAIAIVLSTAATRRGSEISPSVTDSKGNVYVEIRARRQRAADLRGLAGRHGPGPRADAAPPERLGRGLLLDLRRAERWGGGCGLWDVDRVLERDVRRGRARHLDDRSRSDARRDGHRGRPWRGRDLSTGRDVRISRPTAARPTSTPSRTPTVEDTSTTRRPTSSTGTGQSAVRPITRASRPRCTC